MAAQSILRLISPCVRIFVPENVARGLRSRISPLTGRALMALQLRQHALSGPSREIADLQCELDCQRTPRLPFYLMTMRNSSNERGRL